MPAKADTQTTFQAEFGGPPEFLVRSPGRVNLIGEHTDYNEGLVMPLAIEQSLYIAGRSRADDRVVVHSLDYRTTADFSLGDLQERGSGWAEYLKATAWALQEAGFAPAGWEGVMASEIPIGAGLSSSAALELGAALAFRTVSGFDWDPVAMARIGQRAENGWIGVNSGIMDQMIIALGRPRSALKIDCRTLDFEPVPLPDGVQVVVIDSATRRGASGLADSAYNDRRAECEAAARWFGVQSLRDLEIEALTAARGMAPDISYQRARHVVTENRRVAEGVEAMRRQMPDRLGEILKEGHVSQRDDFETSRPEIDALVDIANSRPACFGARLTGGGFGGCVVSLVRDDGVDSFCTEVAARYREASSLEAAFYPTRATEGVRLVGLSQSSD